MQVVLIGKTSNSPLPVSRNTAGSARQLTTSEQRALDARRVTYLRNEFGINYTQGGRTFDGENIDIVRGRDNLVADIKLAQTVLLAAQQGGKLVFTDQDIRAVVNNLENVLNTYGPLGRNFIDNIRVTAPRAAQISAIDRENGELNNIRFTATLLGAITFTDIMGTLSF